MKSIAITYTPILHRVIALLAAVTVLAVFLYGFFLLEAVANTAKRAAAEKHVAELTSQMGALEQQYLTQTRDLTLDQAHQMGFESPKTVTTVYAAGPSKALGYRAN
ncbi:MAG TPA: hypothetical protein VHD31_02335 [Candidatus Paceibacterota bacterium]|nr:hypothetical protein [Candidatus Paceibacterota bacterium]